MGKIQLIYVDMCFKAKEVQNLWKPSISDYYLNRIQKQVFLLTDKKVVDKFECIWLPTEKQLFKIYDVLGNKVTTLVNEVRGVGSYNVEFDASNLSSGIYFYKLQAGSFIETKKMILLK